MPAVITYRIRNWRDLYETSESRRGKVKDFIWVKGYTRFGPRYLRLMNHDNGMEIYGIWRATLCLAATCTPDRGTLADADGPFDADDIAMAISTSAPAVQTALNVLSDRQLRICWMECIRKSSGALPESVRKNSGLEKRREEKRTTTTKTPEAIRKSSGATPDEGGSDLLLLECKNWGITNNGLARLREKCASAELVAAWAAECRTAKNPAGMIIAQIMAGELPPGWAAKQAKRAESDRRAKSDAQAEADFAAIPDDQFPGLVESVAATLRDRYGRAFSSKAIPRAERGEIREQPVWYGGVVEEWRLNNEAVTV